MRLSLRTLLAETFARWRLILLTTSVVAGLIVLGLMTRPPFAASAIVNIGGIHTVGGTGNSDFGLARFLLFEGARQVEDFFTHEVFVNPAYQVGNRCNAIAMYSPDGLRLRIDCRDKTADNARRLVGMAVQPFLDRHARYYELAKQVYTQRRIHIDRQLNGAERVIEILQQPPATNLSEAKIIEKKLEIEQLREQKSLDDSIGDRVRPTQLSSEGISVISRKPGPLIWLTALFMALGSGLFVAFLAARLKHLQNE
ncbi:MAG: hypothetical protein ACK4FK_05550 [Ferrovibrio sp.]|uniref:hypothetical protein n=1 Tax=Ferrovibrio sp. TaxID=1917215 RepID=UPI00391D7AB5